MCFELGNRHLSLKVEEDRVLVPYDYPTMEDTEKGGYERHIIESGFDGFLIVKANAASGTIIPGANKITGDVAEEEQEAEADAAFAAGEHTGHAHDHDTHGDHPYQLKPGEYESNGVLHRPDGSHSHDGGRTWHTH